MAQLKDTKINGTTEHSGGHIYLAGANAGSSTGNTTQLIFGTPSANHVCVSSNEDALVINPDASTTNPQIVLYIKAQSSFPNGITTGSLSVNGKSLLDRTYPVGAVYISYSSTSPADLFGGTWTAITGVFPYFNAGTATGGSNTHTLTTAEMPAHNHTQASHNHYTVTRTAVRYKADAFASGTLSGYQADGDGTHTRPTTSSATPTINNTGGGGSHNNMPAYQTFYAWRRTA